MIVPVFGIMIPITLFIVTGIVIYYLIKTRHQERMAIIERGAEGEALQYLSGKQKDKTADPSRWVKWGFILIAIGLAILIGNQFDEEVTFGLIFMLPGIGLLLYYAMFGKKEKEKEEITP